MTSLVGPGMKPATYLALSSILLIVDAKDFNKWYPSFGSLDKDVWKPCVENLNNITTSPDYCLKVTNCILSDLAESSKASMSGIGVFLGFTPTVMALIGPSTIELAYLSISRPLLSTLCGCSTAGFFFGRLFPLSGREINLGEGVFDAAKEEEEKEHEQHGDMLKVEDGIYRALTTVKPLRRTVTCFEYALAAGAVANTVHNTYQIALQSVISFSCPRSGMLPFIWNVFSLAIQISILMMGQSLRASYRAPSKSQISESSYLQYIRAWFEHETTLSCNSKLAETFTKPLKRPTSKVIGYFVLRWLGDALLLAQLITGTIVMSSIIFVRSQDALFIVLRYLISCLVVRFIVAFEINGMKHSLRRREKNGHRDSMIPLNSNNSGSGVLGWRATI